MNNRTVIIAAVVILAFVLGMRSNRPVIKGSRGESARAQAERLWKDPKARKQRAKNRKQLAKAVAKARR